MRDDMTQEEIDAGGNVGDNEDTAEAPQPDEPMDSNTVGGDDQASSEASEQVAQRAIDESEEAAATLGQLDTLQPTAETRPDVSAKPMASINFLLDVPLDVTVELGRTKIALRDMLQLGPGSVIELDKLIGEPVDLLVNERPIAKGEVVVFDESFGVRITDIINPEDRLKSLG